MIALTLSMLVLSALIGLTYFWCRLTYALWPYHCLTNPQFVSALDDLLVRYGE